MYTECIPPEICYSSARSKDCKSTLKKPLHTLALICADFALLTEPFHAILCYPRLKYGAVPQKRPIKVRDTSHLFPNNNFFTVKKSVKKKKHIYEQMNAVEDLTLSFLRKKKKSCVEFKVWPGTPGTLTLQCWILKLLANYTRLKIFIRTNLHILTYILCH